MYFEQAIDVSNKEYEFLPGNIPRFKHINKPAAIAKTLTLPRPFLPSLPTPYAPTDNISLNLKQPTI
ncbi:hypothetical protein LYNGBM3L_42240 [Moorena producens 3L]|uniref:Uncharacterized protein n=1 Tax=Moorena producens 3L TaxID=489825 RepID=F4XW23_9CYAN|nr:hypothetical protein LYNGBM3L_42240 [Moorena producens 3L]OLT64688.1 hypothetical protein BI334_06255 [Moorena producens 3L]